MKRAEKSSWLFSGCFFQCLGELIRTGSLFEAAFDSFDTGDRLVYIHSFDQAGDALEISVASAAEGHICDFIVYDIKMDLS